MTAVIEFHFDVRLLCWQMYLVMCDLVLLNNNNKNNNNNKIWLRGKFHPDFSVEQEILKIERLHIHGNEVDMDVLYKDGNGSTSYSAKNYLNK